MSRVDLKNQIAQAVRPNLFERALATVMPRLAVNRMRARAALAWGGYNAARYDRKALKTFIATKGDADDVTLGALETLRDRSRELVRNEPIARGAIGTVVSKVVGQGLTLQSRPDAETLKLTPDQSAELSKQIEREFSLWADTTDCDITRTQTFAGLTELFFWSALESGDCFALTPTPTLRPGAVYRTVLQIVEADRVCNPQGMLMDTDKLKAGIEYDAQGAPLRYHVRRKHPQSSGAMSDKAEDVIEAFGKRTGRRNVIHGFKRERPGQTRGVPYLSPVIEALKQLGRYTDAEVDAAVLSAMFTVFVTSPQGDGFAPPDLEGADVSASSANIDPSTEVALGSGSIVDLMPGEKPEFANPSRPNDKFDPFVQAIVRQVGIALGIPYEVLIKHFTASYSAARAALLEAWEFFKQRRAWLVQVFVQPAFECWFDEAVAFGRIDAPGYFADAAIRRAYLKAEWIGPQPQSLDAEKDANAAKTRLEIGADTLADVTLQLTGKDYEQQHAQQVRERQMRLRDGLSVPGAPQSPVTPAPGAPGQNKNGNPDQPDKPDQPDQPDQSEDN